MAPGLGTPAVDAALSKVGLGDIAGRRVGGFSRGMLQPLGIAATIVSKPGLLVFDEPASALHQLGRYEGLELIGRLATRSTVLFSSHTLADVQRVCDTVGVLNHGRLLYQGPLEALLTECVQPAYLVRVRPPIEPVAEALRHEWWAASVTDAGHGQLRVQVTSVPDAELRIARVLAREGARVICIDSEAPDREAVFLELVSRPFGGSSCCGCSGRCTGGGAGLVPRVRDRHSDPDQVPRVLYRNVGGDVRIVAPPPTPQLSLASYPQNAFQIGSFVTVLIAASTLVFDAKPEWAAFLRTRSPSLARLVVPKAAVIAGRRPPVSCSAWRRRGSGRWR